MKKNPLGLFCAGLLLLASLNVTTANAQVVVSTDPPGLTVSVDGNTYTAPASFNWLPATTHSIEAPSPQARSDGHSRNVYLSWSDGGAQKHEVVAPAWATNCTAAFSTQYLLNAAVTPANGGAVSNYPAGPWYDPGQAVSLTAITNDGYRFSAWTGVDAESNDTATVAVNGYREIGALFLPSNFPFYDVIDNGGAAPGVLVGNIGGRRADGTTLTYVVLDNSGLHPLFSSTTETLSRFLTAQGLDAVSANGGFDLKDETFSVTGSVSPVGYTADGHDMKLLPNGHALVFGTESRSVDMSRIVTNGRPDASVTGDVLQEIDGDNRVVFEWHTFDHIPITNSFFDLTQPNIDYAHLNAMCLDPTDNNLLISMRTTSEIVKINRRTGDVMWRLGGKANMFAFIGEHEENAPYFTVGQHDIHRLANGNLLFFDNGNISGGGITPSDRTYSRAVEYRLDETNMTATLVWEFRHTPDISAPCTGSVKRFENGNTLIDWGCAVPSSGTMVTEVSPGAEVIFEMRHHQAGGITSPLLGAGLTKQLWNSPDVHRGTNFSGVVSGESYASTEAGVSVTISNLTGGADNTLVVRRYLDAVRFPRFAGKAPQVLMEHVLLSATNIDSLRADVDLELPHTTYPFDAPIIHDPAEVTVYYRPTFGQGEFSPLPTAYDSASHTVRVTVTGAGEFIFGYPDVGETVSEPVIAGPPDQSEINQAEPIALSWKPQGLFASTDLQLATNADFSNPALETNLLGTTSFALQDPLPNTHYFWRVRILNADGTSGWVSSSFTTVPPILHLIYPAGGEVWQRFQVVTIRWEDNLAENVALDIYKGGELNRTFVFSAPSSGSYTWTVGQFQGFPPGTNYTLRIRSTTDSSIYDTSGNFSMITNLTSVTIDGGSVTALPDGRIQFGISIPGAVGATVLGSTNLLDWEALQTVTLDANGAAEFIDNSAANSPARFYRLRIP